MIFPTKYLSIILKYTLKLKLLFFWNAEPIQRFPRWSGGNRLVLPKVYYHKFYYIFHHSNSLNSVMLWTGPCIVRTVMPEFLISHITLLTLSVVLSKFGLSSCRVTTHKTLKGSKIVHNLAICWVTWCSWESCIALSWCRRSCQK